MTFGEIIKHLKNKQKVSRSIWFRNSSKPYIILDSKQEYFQMFEGDKCYSKQCMLHAYDLLADDWLIIE